MPARRSPSVRARQLAAELRRLRSAAILSGDEVATRLGWSPSKLSRIETGRTAITVQDLRLLLESYEVSDQLRDRLINLARSAGRRGWWDAYDDTLRQGYSTLLALEDVAEFELSYNQMLVPGLLQTEAYVRAVIGPTDDLPPGEISRRVTVRMARQRLLAKENPLKTVAILEEACLRRIVGSPALMREQISHLIDVVQLSNVDLQILPFTVGFHQGLAGTYKILRFPEEGAGDIVFLENMTSDLFIEDEREVYGYVRAFGNLQDSALKGQDALEAMRRIADELGQE